jgi:hypothetical protein
MSTEMMDRGQRAGAENHRRGLRPLRGSDKQAAFGEIVRAGKLRQAEELIRSATGRGDKQAATDLAQWTKSLRVQGEARWWLDRKEEPVAELLWQASGTVR